MYVNISVYTGSHGDHQRVLDALELEWQGACWFPNMGAGIYTPVL